MAKASTQPRPSWEQLSDSSQRIYLALAEGDQQRARQLYQQDQPQRRRQRRRATRVQPNAALVICGGLWSVAGAGSRRRWPTPKPGSGGNGASKVRPRSGQPIPGLLIPGGRWDSTNPSQRRCSSVPNWWCGSGTGIGRLAGCGMPPTAASPSNHRRLTPAAILQQQRRTC
jgi:hypothetical protein